MMNGFTAFAVVALLATPAAAQPREQPQAEAQVDEGARWLVGLAEAISVGSESARALNQSMQALVAQPLTRERIAAATPTMRAQIERARGDVRKSNAMLDALPSLSPAVAREMQPDQHIRDVRAHNERLLGFLDASDAFVIAMGKGDSPGMERSLPRMLEGSFDMLNQQRLLIRARQASAPETDSSYQSLGVAGQLYRAMEAVLRGSVAVRLGSEAEGTKAAAAAQEELRLVARDTRALAVAGRRNLAREMAEIDAERRAGKAAETGMMDRIRSAYAEEERVFALADRLAALTDADGAITAAQLRAVGAASAMAPLRPLEQELIAITAHQADLLAGVE